jgi:hypothetical protein
MFADAFNNGDSRLPALRGRAVAEKRTHRAWGAKGQMRGVPAHVHSLAQGAALRPEVQGAGRGGVPGQDEHSGHHAHLWGLLPDCHGLGGGKKSGGFPPSRTRCCPAKKATCWSWMNSGASWRRKASNAGCGSPFAQEPARSSLIPWPTAARREHRACASTCPTITVAGRRAAIFGWLMRVPFLNAPIASAAKRKARPTTSNDGSARCAHASAAWCAEPTPFPKTLSATSTPSIFSSPPTTSESNNSQRPANHYPIVRQLAKQTPLSRALIRKRVLCKSMAM